MEREIVSLHQKAGIDAERVPLSGAAGGSFAGDVILMPERLERNLIVEVKARARGEGFAVIERWLGDYDALVLKRNNAAPLVVVPWHVWLEILKGGSQ